MYVTILLSAGKLRECPCCQTRHESASPTNYALADVIERQVTFAEVEMILRDPSYAIHASQLDISLHYLKTCVPILICTSKIPDMDESALSAIVLANPSQMMCSPG
jgi:hypothetical protein